MTNKEETDGRDGALEALYDPSEIEGKLQGCIDGATDSAKQMGRVQAPMDVFEDAIKKIKELRIENQKLKNDQQKVSAENRAEASSALETMRLGEE